MTRLLDLPEELLSYICEETDKQSLISLATSCKVFNRLAGWRYLFLIGFNNILSSLLISEWSRLRSSSWIDLQNASRILGSLSQFQEISCEFSSEHLLREMKLLARVLQRIQVDVSSLTLTFSVGRTSTLYPYDFLFYPNAPCVKAFNDIVEGARRKNIRTLKISGRLPLIRGPLNFPQSHPLDTSLTTLSIGEISSTYRSWFIRFLNTSSNLTCINAGACGEWGKILPKVHITPLQSFIFGTQLPSVIHMINIKIFADFIQRHQYLNSVSCGPLVEVVSTHQQRAPSRHSLASLHSIVGSPSQLHYFLSDSDALVNLRSVEVVHDHSSEDIDILDLFSLMYMRSTITTLKFPAFIERSQNLVFQENRSVESKLLHVVSVGIKDFYIFSTLNGPGVVEQMLSWGCKVFPNAHTLILDDSPRNTTPALFASILSREWRSIKTLVIHSESDSVEAWCSRKD